MSINSLKTSIEQPNFEIHNQITAMHFDTFFRNGYIIIIFSLVAPCMLYAQNGKGPGEDNIDLRNLLSSHCDTTKIDSSKKGESSFVVTPRGEVRYSPEKPILEGKKITVTTYVTKDLFPNLILRRSSGFRINTHRISGTPSLVTAPEALYIKPADCMPFTRTLSDFEPGIGQFTFSVIMEDDILDLGTVDFEVRSAYSGAVSIGVVATTLFQKERHYDAIPQDEGPSILIERAGEDLQSLYVLLFTPFFKKRDIKADFSLNNFGLTFGTGLNEPARHYVVGADIDLNPVLPAHLTGGLHLGKVNRLHPDFNETLQDTFTGSTDEIPLEKKWRHGWFFGLTIDAGIVIGILGTAAEAIIGG